MAVVQTHTAVRLCLMEDLRAARTCVVHHLLYRRCFLLPIQAAALLTACFKARPAEDVIDELTLHFGWTAHAVQGLVDALWTRQLLVSPEDPKHRHLQEEAARLQQYGWYAAWDYRLMTHDYEFLDYASDGNSLDVTQMGEYSRTEADTDRSKFYPYALRSIALECPRQELLPRRFDYASQQFNADSSWSAESLFTLLVMTFGSTGLLRLPWPGAHPAYRKTSPSMGARHATEVYLDVLDVKGLCPGWYHFCVENNALEFIMEPPKTSNIFMARTMRALGSASVRAVLFLTVVFERSMFRYREPHVLRSLHLDVGHLCSSAETVAASLGICSGIIYDFPIDNVEHELGLRGLQEGMFAAIWLK